MLDRTISGWVLVGLLAACTPARPALRAAPAPPALPGQRADLEVIEIERVESSASAGAVNIRAANTTAQPALLAVDLRAEPGMWLAPVQQQTALFWLPPRGERAVTVSYTFARLSPGSVLRVRVGTPEEHVDGWVHIPEPAAVRRFEVGASAEAAAFLERFDTRRTEHLTVHALRGMFAPQALDSLAADRERAVGALGRLLDVNVPPDITLVFYPDAASKTADTHHVGAGLARGTTIVEIRNDSVRLDPYHEIAHVVAGQLGWALAWLSEGLAVYASEVLGSDALAQLGSPGKSVDRAACEFRRAGQLLSISEVIRLQDIGPEESRPHVSYAQAASFTGFLARHFGLPALRRAYATLTPAASDEQNDAAFFEAFGVSVDDAAALWTASNATACN